MACIISSVIIVFAVIGAMIFLVLKSDRVSLAPDELAELIKSRGVSITVRISGMHRCRIKERANWRENPSKEKSVK